MTRILWTHADAILATGGRTQGSWAAGGVSIDSRTLQRGDLFVALKGPRFDGHDFVAAAFDAGAAAAMVERKPAVCPAEAKLLVVGDSLKGLNDLARFARARAQAAVAAITGSVGKTSVKEALRHCLGAQSETHASLASLNNQWGVPLSVARLAPKAHYAVFEIGMNHPGEIAPLAQLVRPHVAVITTVETVHLEFFPNERAIADAKAEIFLGLEPGGTVILNRDNPHFARLERRARDRNIGRIVCFGTHPEARVRLVNYTLYATAVSVMADVGGRILSYRIGAAGRHWAMNSLAVLAAVEALGGDVGLAALAFASLSPLQGRGRRHQVEIAGGSIELIDDSHNASPASMRAAFDNLAGTQPGGRGRRIAVLGDMLELGPTARRLHADLAVDLVPSADLVFAAGPLMGALFEALPSSRRGALAKDARALIAPLLSALRPGDVVLIKGSFASNMGVIVEALLRKSALPRAANG
jgi:UDP-N-acetylmuramoyl-tripeptide--D-alanyl-D-alanine ligase